MRHGRTCWSSHPQDDRDTACPAAHRASWILLAARGLGQEGSQDLLGGTYRVDGPRAHPLGFGALQLAGPGVFGPPQDRDAAIALPRGAAVDLGIRPIDTADFYGPHVTNETTREALTPYPDELNLVTKVSARHDEQGGRPHSSTPAELRKSTATCATSGSTCSTS